MSLSWVFMWNYLNYYCCLVLCQELDLVVSNRNQVITAQRNHSYFCESKKRKIVRKKRRRKTFNQQRKQRGKETKVLEKKFGSLTPLCTATHVSERKIRETEEEEKRWRRRRVEQYKGYEGKNVKKGNGRSNIRRCKREKEK